MSYVIMYYYIYTCMHMYVYVQGQVLTTHLFQLPHSQGIVPPDDIRRRIRLTRGMLEKDILGGNLSSASARTRACVLVERCAAYIGDTVWEYLVLRHQYQQAREQTSPVASGLLLCHLQ